jgi:hypothetical protein
MMMQNATNAPLTKRYNVLPEIPSRQDETDEHPDLIDIYGRCAQKNRGEATAGFVSAFSVATLFKNVANCNRSG